MAHITPSQPRTTIRVTLANNMVLEGGVGTTAGEFLVEAARYEAPEQPVIAAICDGQLRELTYPVRRDMALIPVLLSHSDGGRIYRRSLVMLLATAAAELWLGCRVSVRYSVPDGGFYCTRLNDKPFTPAELDQLEHHMRQIVEADERITKRMVALDDAVALFASRQEDDKVRLLEQRTRQELTLYTLRGRDDYFYGYMVPSTGLLRTFRLIWVRDGFILQYPTPENPAQLRPLRAYDKLSKVFRQADHWLQRLGIEDVGRLNRIINNEIALQELILVAEALHEQHVAAIAHQIADRHTLEGLRLVLIAGPSSSGKTTFAKRLAIQLLAEGLRPFMIELDNYFVDRELTPRDEKGEYDFEHLAAINLPLFNEHLLKLNRYEEVVIPRFDFYSGKSRPDRRVRLRENQIVIIEGIHGLNPNLVPDIPATMLHRIYISALTQLNIDAHNRVATTDMRLIRRIVRDARTRGYNATETLQRWNSVRRGEKVNIFPYQENANSMFNSALPYELAALRPLAEPLLLQVTPNTPPHVEAKRLLSFLGWVRPLGVHQLRHIPSTSLLREFIGESSLQNYHPEPPLPLEN